MTRRQHLGSVRTAPIGLGCMGLSQGYGPTDEQESTEAIRVALDAGTTMFDTAMSYGNGHNERLVGAALSGTGAQIATKFGIIRDETGVRQDAAPDRIHGYCEASLHRLGRDVIDLCYLHRVDPDYPIEDQIGAMAELVEAGMVRHLGVSEVTAEQLRRAHAVAPITAVQLEWSLAWRAPERDVIPAARELGIGVVAYSPLGRGLLTADAGSQDPGTSGFRGNDARFGSEALATNIAQAAELRDLAGEIDATPGQLALAWLLAQGDDVLPIPGSRRPERILENIGAARIDLDPARIARLDRIADGFVGDRYSFAVPSTRR